MSIINGFLSHIVTNTTVQIDDGLSLKRALFSLQERLPGQRQSIKDVADTMRVAVGDALIEGISDFEQFVKNWVLEISVWNSFADTNIIIVKMRERNACPRDYEFKFVNLNRSSI